MSEKRYIFIDLYEKNNNIYLEIKDNERGIDTLVKKNIFDEHYSSKINKQAAGVGLYLTKLIIEKHMKGTLLVENKEFLYKNEHFYGALFTIKLQG